MDPITGAALIQTGGAVLGGLLGKKGASDTNARNLQIAREQMAFQADQATQSRNFNSAEAAAANMRNQHNMSLQHMYNRRTIQDQMNFQKEMSDTAVTRRVADLKAAGINPILAGKYDASSPAGGALNNALPTATAASQGSIPTGAAIPAINELQSMMSTALQVANTLADIKYKTAQTKESTQRYNTKKPKETVNKVVDKALEKTISGAEDLYDNSFGKLNKGIQNYSAKTYKYVEDKVNYIGKKLQDEKDAYNKHKQDQIFWLRN